MKEKKKKKKARFNQSGGLLYTFPSIIFNLEMSLPTWMLANPVLSSQKPVCE